MARYGSQAIRGHGIPEAMEQVLTNQSRIPARMTLLKPLSAAIAIGTGGPFGAEGPIIATGGALGSLRRPAASRRPRDERKTLLAAGAAAGMAATFGSPVSAVLLAVELLLFEYRPRSLIPVALAAAAAAGRAHRASSAPAPVFAMPTLAQPSGARARRLRRRSARSSASPRSCVTRAVYAVEDALRAAADPLDVVAGARRASPSASSATSRRARWASATTTSTTSSAARSPAARCVVLCVMKFVSWSIALGSGTSGGTLAPLFTIGGGLGALLGVARRVARCRTLGVDPRIAALVGMAAMFAGASRALLASVVFAFETTRQPLGLLPLLGGCTAAYLVSCLLMRNSIMTEKIARRGVRVAGEYAADFLASRPCART